MLRIPGITASSMFAGSVSGTVYQLHERPPVRCQFFIVMPCLSVDILLFHVDIVQLLGRELSGEGRPLSEQAFQYFRRFLHRAVIKLAVGIAQPVVQRVYILLQLHLDTFEDREDTCRL